MREGYKVFFQGAGFALFALVAMANAVVGNFIMMAVMFVAATAVLWCGLKNADKLP